MQLFFFIAEPNTSNIILQLSSAAESRMAVYFSPFLAAISLSTLNTK